MNFLGFVAGMFGVAPPSRFDKCDGYANFLIRTVAFQNKIKVMAIAVGIRPTDFFAFSSLACTLLIEKQTMLPGEFLQGRQECAFQNFTNDLAELMRI